MSRRSILMLLVPMLLALPVRVAMAEATINLIITDAPGTGFFDPTPRSPVLNNPGITLGEQRRNVFDAALRFWEERLDSVVDIDVQVAFERQICTPERTVLGSAGARSLSRDFANAPRPDTWYPGALANSLAGVDLSPDEVDVAASFNSALDDDDDCLSGESWDYRINPPDPGDLTLASTVLHELAHGLGFATFANGLTGARLGNMDDHFSIFLRDLTQDKNWPEMDNAERVASAINDGNLVWNGAKASVQSDFLVDGRNAGSPRLYAPATFQQGGSLSHWDIALQPNELLEPNALLDEENWLTLKAMYDMGWQGNPCIKTELPNDGWILFSLDCVPPANENTVADVLGDDIDGEYNQEWIVYEYGTNESSPGGGYIRLALDDELQPGKGYWLLQTAGTTGTVIDVPADSSRTPSPANCDSANGCFETSLLTIQGQDAFTLIGNPYRYPIAVDDLRVITDSGTCIDPCTLAEADANGVASSVIVAYDLSSSTYQVLSSGDMLDARAGAWSTTPAGSEGLNPRLLLPR